MTRIVKVTTDKKRFLPLLLLGDPQEAMIDTYLAEGDMFALYEDGKLRTIAVISKEQKRVFALSNIVTEPTSRRQGYGRKMVEHLLAYYHGRGRLLQAGIRPGSSTAAFCEACGFRSGKSDTELTYYQREL